MDFRVQHFGTFPSLGGSVDQNEDTVGYSGNLAWVLDGVTKKHDVPFTDEEPNEVR